MGFAWAKYLVLAEELAVRSTDEASLRSSISRAYYAVFCTARNRLLEEGEEIPKTGEAHAEVWTKYRESAQKRRKYIGITGDRLRRSRNKADYDDEFPSISAVVQDAVVKARHLLDSLGGLDSGKH
ncbi:MAG: HEPN domain-containing protein [Chloroflexi bacterium]|nr:HEPN domain-containing protein [Chloroflexota bacterium]